MMKTKWIVTGIYAVLVVVLHSGVAAQDVRQPSFRVGDLVRFDSMTPDGAPGMIPVSTSLDDLRAFSVRYFAEIKDGGFRSIEGMMFVGNNTPATILGLETITIESEPRYFAHVSLGSGAFRGQKLWTYARRLRPANAPDPVRAFWSSGPKAKPAPVDQEEFKGERRHDKLILTDLTSNPSVTGRYMNVSGHFRNSSGNDLKAVRVTVSFRDKTGELVRSEWAFSDPKSIRPGEIGIFEVSAANDERYSYVKLDFMDLENHLQWSDESGKRAHP